MQKNFLMLICAAFFTFACKSAPATVEKPLAEDNSGAQNAQVAPAEKDKIINYDALGALIAEAEQKRTAITNDNLEADNLEPLGVADNSLASAKSLYDKGPDAISVQEKQQSHDDAQSALDAYNTILNAYWKPKADDAREKAMAAQLEALKIKANVAVRKEYDASNDVFGAGEKFYRLQEYRAATPQYIEAKGLFDNATALAAEKRRLADLALSSAEKKIQESEKIATDADAQLQGATPEAE